jgi:hypothetical protein
VVPFNEQRLEKAMKHFTDMADTEQRPSAYRHTAAALSGMAVLWLSLYNNDYGLEVVEQRIEPLINEYKERAKKAARK